MKNVFYWKNRQINKALNKEIPLSLNPSFIDDCIMNVHNITFFLLTRFQTILKL